MKKWLSVLLMTSLLFGAAYFAVATESGRKVISQTETLRAMLSDIDALLAKDQTNSDLQRKHAEVVAELASNGIAAPAASSAGIDEGKIRALAEEQSRLEANGEYYDMLLERMNQGSALTPVEKIELLQSGVLKGEEDPAYQALFSDAEEIANSYLDILEQRYANNDQLTEIEKIRLEESGRLEERNEGGAIDGQGADCFGYRYVDNLNGDTATFAWEDIVGQAGTVLLTAISNNDDAVTSVPLTFSFPFYGVNRTTVYPSSNGTVSMTSAQTFTNSCTLPSSTFPSGAIFPLWDDQDTRQGGNGTNGSVSDSGAVYYNDNGSRVIIQWDSVGRHLATADWLTNYTYQVILYSDGKIKVQYLALNRLAPSVAYPSATVGIQQGSTAPNNNYVSYLCNTNADLTQESLTGRAIWFYPDAPIANDFVSTSLVAPALGSRIYANVPFNVIGRFRNVGTTAQASDVGYIFDNGAPVTGITANLAACATGDVDFAGTQAGPAAPGSYVMKLFSNLATDGIRGNDTTRVTLTAVNCYDEIQTNAFADTFTTCGAINDWANTCLGTADGSEDYIYQWNITQPGAYNILAIGTTTTTRGLLVSSACPPDSFNCLAALNQSQDTLLINCLTLNVGTYYIMVDRSSGCDQVRLYTAPCQDHDYAIESIVSPSPLRVSPSASFNVVGRFRNIGTATEAADVSYRFNGGAVVSGVTAAVAPGLSTDVDFTGTETAPAVVGDYELLMYSNLTTDQNRFNDTLRVTVLVRDCSDEDQSGAFTDIGTTCGASNEWANTCLGTADASEDYIYRWTTASNGSWNLLLTATTSATRGLVVSTACPPDSFNCVAFINTTNDSAALSCVPLAAGTYYIMVDRSTGCDAYTLAVSPCTTIGRCCYNAGVDCADNGAYDCQQLGGQWTSTTTCAASPCPIAIEGGETCATAVGITVPATVRGTTTGGTDDDPGAQCALGSTDPYEGSNTAPDDWYSITGTGNQITVSLCAAYTTYDTQILVVCSDNCTNFTCVAGNDDATCSFSGLRSTATFCSELGRNYYVVVDGWSTAAGPFELSVVEGAACADFVDCAPEGRCCYLNNGVAACVDNLAAECATLSGQWNDAASCANDPCPVGRCCYINNGVAACADFTDLECQAVAGQWTSTTTCAATPCPVGRCCYNDGGNTVCADNTELECGLLNGLWDDLLSCATDPCPQVLQGTDSCYNAPLIALLDQPYLGSNVGATADSMVFTSGAACSLEYGGTGPHLGVWYSFIGTGNGMTVHTCGDVTTYDSEIYVFCNTCDSLMCVDSDDDSCTTPALGSSTQFCTVLGATYYTLISAYSTGTGDFTVTVSDDGLPCTPLVDCPAPACDAPVDLRAYVVTSANVPQSIQLHFTAPQDADYKVWYSANPNNDGNPNDGTDPDFFLETTLTGILDGQLVVYNSPSAFVNYRYYVVTADCGN